MTCLDRWQHLPRIRLALLSLFACLFAAEAHGLVLAHEDKTGSEGSTRVIELWIQPSPTQ